MMRSPDWWALAVRRPDARVHIESHQVRKRAGAWSQPLLRGIIALVDTLGIGMRALSTAARVSTGEEEGVTTRDIAIAVVLAVVFFVGIFVVLPAVLVRGGHSSGGGGKLARNLIEGLVRIGIFLAYIIGVSFIPDIRRVFQYHGAEHKVIAAYEAGAPDTIEGAKPFSTVHVRCGTDFLFLVMILSVLIFSLFGRPPTIAARIGSRILLLPVVAALSYEMLRLAARHERNPLVRLITWPGRALQRITTREPDDTQLEIALASLHELLAREGVHTTPGPEAPEAA